MDTGKKKILFISQYFYPEVFRGNDVAFHLAKEGHQVHVVTGIPNYPGGRFFDGYGLLKNRHEIIDGVKVTRLPIIPRGKDNKLLLMLNYFSYLIISCIWIFFHSIWYKYDRIFVQQLSPVMMSAPGVLYKRLRRVPLYTWVLDLWPESLTAAGGINNKYVLNFFKWFVRIEYKHSTKILISSRSFKNSIIEYGNYENKIIYFPQWADKTENTERSINVPKLPDGFKLMFAGAVGEAHGFDCTLQAALLTKEYKEIKWVIVGDGRRLEQIRQFVIQNGLDDTVLTMGRYPSGAMPMFFEQADVMLVTLNDDPLFKLYAPAKISSYMASARPIIAVLNGEGEDVIKEADCGWHIPAGNYKAFAQLAVELSQTDKSILREKGMNGFRYYEEHYTKEKSLIKLEKIMGL